MNRPAAKPSAVTLRTPDELRAAGLVGPDQAADLHEVAARYAVAVTPAMSALIDPAHADDPIARQFVPDRRELDRAPGERDDPIGDEAHEAVRGLIHRYPDRALLKLVSACAVYCRFCFRREQVGSGAGNLGRDDIAKVMAYLKRHPEIWEVILSGGDPMVASPRRLGEIVADLAAIDHIGVVRFHTRIPVVEPERIDAAMASALVAEGAASWLALHINHPRELTPEARAALHRLKAAGVHLVAQTVLLRGVNDDAAVLAHLMRGLVAAGVKPYYLHHPDPAPGTGHFRLTIGEGQALVAELRKRVSGLCMPTYVLDIPGGYGKVPVERSAVSAEAGRTIATDRAGRRHVVDLTESSSC